MTPPERSTRIIRLLAKLLAGQTLCQGFIKSETGINHLYWLDPSGRQVGKWTVNRALELGLIAPNGDGLLPGDTQTYRVVLKEKEQDVPSE